MKTFRVPLVFLLITMAVRAQDAAPTDPAGTVIVSAQRSPEELEQLLAPIALYPDALIALILPASTVPTDIVLASRHVRDNPGDRAQIEHRAWDESVKSLTNYPDVLKWMDENLHWTRQVGEAFALQPADVMQAVQRLRAKARAAGTLVDTPQQQVIAEQQIIRIVPAQPDIIYVPHYEPEVVFVDRPVYYTRPFVTFGLGVAVGSWLAYDCDWRHNSIWIGNRHRRWTGHDWRRPLVPFSASYSHSRNVHTPAVRKWHPSPVSRTTVTASNRFRSDVVRPAPLGFAGSRAPLTHPSTSFRSQDSRNAASHTFRSQESRDAASHTFRSQQSRHAASHTFRDSSATNRSRSADTHPVVPAVPRNFSPGFRSDGVGSRAAAPVVAPPLPTARINPLNTSPAPGAGAQPSFQNRHPVSGDGVRDYGNRSRSFRSAQPAITAPLPVAPALPMVTRPRSTQPVGPTVPQRSFSRGASTPTAVPALPMHNRAARPAAVGPVAPQVAPQSAPATAVPQAAPVQRGGGEYRGHRGASGRRS